MQCLVEQSCTLTAALADPRFSNIQTDPRFIFPSRINTHVHIDKRFAPVLRDESFSRKTKVDRYGRRISRKSARKEFEKYYDIEGKDEQDVGGRIDEDAGVAQQLERLNAGDGDLLSSGESSSDDQEFEEEVEDEGFGLLEGQAVGDGDIPKGEVSSRIAVVNLDWDNIRAADLMAVFSSFVPSSGRILKVSVYPSEFGKQRLEQEEMEGPPREIFERGGANGMGEGRFLDDEEHMKEEGDKADNGKTIESIMTEDDGCEVNPAKLRRYQLERLRYYYAVLDCSSVSVAQSIYDVVDGTEYLSTANLFDLRYIPDEVDFADDNYRDQCEKIPDGYRPNDFVTDALQHSKVRLTWDADDRTRKDAQKRAFAGSRMDIDENDLKAYLGSDSSEDEDPESFLNDATPSTANGGFEDNVMTIGQSALTGSKKDTERQRLRVLLGLPKDSATSKKAKAGKSTPIGGMQITFSLGLASEPKDSVFENEPERDETSVEKYVRREKERKARRKEKLKDSHNNTDLTNGKKETKGGVDAPSIGNNRGTDDLGFSDPFFAGPSHKTAKNTTQHKTEKRQKREQQPSDEAAAAAQRAELELLMTDDRANHNDANHFNINEIAKAEKTLFKKKKSRKGISKREEEALAWKDKDSFKIDVGDDRFKEVFQRSEFAIDPSHSRFKGTEGMNQLLDEGRKRRLMDGPNAREEDGAFGKLKIVKGKGQLGDDLQKLVSMAQRR